jgi:hypothetical protein
VHAALLAASVVLFLVSAWMLHMASRRLAQARAQAIARPAARAPLTDDMARRLRELTQTRDRDQLVLKERERMLEALRLSEERYRVLFEGNPLPVWTFDAETLRFCAVNEAAVRTYGYSREELLAMKASDLKPAEDVAAMRTQVDQDVARGGIIPVGVKRHRTRDGRELQMEIVAHAVHLEGRRTMLAIGTDVTERRRLEEQLRQAQKMDAIGRLAGGIAHDFNNILSIILNYTEFVADGVGPDHAVAPDLREVVTAAKRAASLTNQLLVFSRKQTPQLKAVELNPLVRDFERMLARVLGEHIEVRADLDPHLGSVKADRTQLEQVLMNLAVNARDAMPDGGRLTIETANVTLSSSEAQALALPAGDYVTFAVHDTGCGMDQATAARIFDPFFTTKGVGKGTGLGLSTAFGIVQGHLGAIAVTTAPGRGSTFRVHMPLIAARAVPAPAGTPPSPSPGTETILVVDDDPGVRNAARRALLRAGYTVLEARNAHAALDVLHDRGHEVAAVLTDVVMPHVDGPTMVRQALERFPHLRILYMSGYSEHESVKVPLAEGDRFLAKPFETAELLAAIREVIDGASVAA